MKNIKFVQNTATPGTVYAIGRVSKPLTAALAAALWHHAGTRAGSTAVAGRTQRRQGRH